VEADPPGASHDGLGHVVGPLVGELVGVDLDRLGRLGEDRGAERPGGLGGLPGEGLPWPADGHGADLGELAGVFAFDGVVSLALGGHLGLVGGQLVGLEVAALGAGAGQDFIGAGAGRVPLLPEAIEQVRHSPTSSISHLDSRDNRNDNRYQSY
jgi:hypothetical protein